MAIVDAVLASSNVLETDYAAYDPAHAYAAGEYAIVVAANVHKVYQSLQAANTGHPPATSSTWWLDSGATNRWKMFDALVGSQTSNADNIAVVFNALGRADSVALLNMSAGSVHITMTDAVDGVVYDQTISVISDSGIQDAYAYCFEPIIRKTDLAVTNLPPYSNASIAVTLADAGATVKCGECVVGLSRNVGDTQYGATVGIQDYSIKSADAFGNFTITQRAFAKRADFIVWVAGGSVDALQTFLASLRATPIVYVGIDTYGATIVYGFFKDFSIAIAYPTESICTIQIEGLT